MNPQELRKIGESLFGPRWKSSLARALSTESHRLDVRTVRRWASGERSISSSVEIAIKSLKRSKAAKFAKPAPKTKKPPAG
jgi:hypothetical protein